MQARFALPRTLHERSVKVQAAAPVQARTARRSVVVCAADSRSAAGFAAAALAAAVLVHAPLAHADLVSLETEGWLGGWVCGLREPEGSAGLRRRSGAACCARLSAPGALVGLAPAQDNTTRTALPSTNARKQTEDLLAKSTANKALHDKQRLVSSYSNFARSRTVSDGTCTIANNWFGCDV